MVRSCQQEQRGPHQRLREDCWASGFLRGRSQLSVRMERTCSAEAAGATGVTLMHVDEAIRDYMLVSRNGSAAALLTSADTLAPRLGAVE